MTKIEKNKIKTGSLLLSHAGSLCVIVEVTSSKTYRGLNITRGNWFELYQELSDIAEILVE